MVLKEGSAPVCIRLRFADTPSALRLVLRQNDPWAVEAEALFRRIGRFKKLSATYCSLPSGSPAAQI